MFHSDLLEGMDWIAHCAQEREGRGRIVCRTIEEDDDKLGQAVTNMALTSLKRLAERQAVIKTGTRRNAAWAFNKDRALHRFTYFG